MTVKLLYAGARHDFEAGPAVKQTARERLATFASNRSGSWEEFVRRFDPIDPPEGGTLWETHQVIAVDPAHAWTVVDGENGKTYVMEGWHLVNRLGFIIARNPREAMPERGDAYKVFTY